MDANRNVLYACDGLRTRYIPKLMDTISDMFVKTLKLMATYISGFTVFCASALLINKLHSHVSAPQDIIELCF